MVAGNAEAVGTSPKATIRKKPFTRTFCIWSAKRTMRKRKKQANSLRWSKSGNCFGTSTVRPWEAKFRVVLIHEADRMNAAAQNALLKTLEEPSQRIRTLFILLTHRPNALLQTIHSRSQVVRFHTVSARVIVETLVKEHNIVLEKARLAAALSGGSPQTALDLCQDEAVWQEREESLDGWAKLSAKTPEEAQELPCRWPRTGERFKPLPALHDFLASGSDDDPR